MIYYIFKKRIKHNSDRKKNKALDIFFKKIIDIKKIRKIILFSSFIIVTGITSSLTSSIYAAGCIIYDSQVNSAMTRQDITSNLITFKWKTYTDGCETTGSEYETKTDSEWRFKIYRMDGASSSLEAEFDGTQWLQTNHFTRISFERNGADDTYDLTLKSMNAAVVDSDYYITIQRVTGDANETLEVESKASTTADGNGNKGLGGGTGTGEFSVNYASLYVIFSAADTRINSRSAVPFTSGSDGSIDGQTGTNFKQGDINSNSVIFAYQIKYPDGTDWNKSNALLNLRVFTSSNADVTAQYSVFDAGYSNPYYYTRIVPTTNAVVGNDMYFSVSTVASSTATGDYLAEFASKAGTSGSNSGLLGQTPDGKFDTIPGDLYIEYLSRSATQIDRGASSGVTYTYRAFFPNATQEASSSADYLIKVYNSSGVDKTSDFNITSPTYNGGSSSWEISIAAKAVATIGVGYYISVEKISGVSESLLSEYASNQGTTSNNVGLGSPGGEFEVREGSLHIVYDGPSSPQTIFKANDSATTTYTYNVFYADDVTEESSDYGYTIKVYRSDVPGTARSTFIISSPGTQFGVLDTGSHIDGGEFILRQWQYTGGKWNINLKASPDALDTVGGANDALYYYITIEKDTGGSGETFSTYASDASTTPDGNGNAGLGVTNGRFEVDSSTLTVKYQSRDNASMQRRDIDASLVEYHFSVHYPDGSQEINDNGYQVELFNSSGTSMATWTNLAYDTGIVNQAQGEWVLVSYDYSGGSYNVKLKGAEDADDEAGYYIEISKATGNEGDTTASSKSSKEAVGTLYDGGLENTNGVFELQAASLSVAIADPGSHQSIEVADDDTISFTGTVTYPDGTAAQVLDGGYVVTLYDSGDNPVETFTGIASGDTATGSIFDLNEFVNTVGSYAITLQSHDKTTPIGNDYYLSLQKASNGNDEEDILAEENSKTDPGAVNGSFDVTAATLSISFGNITTNSINKGDTTGLTLYYNTYFDRGSVGSDAAAYQEADDAGNYSVIIRDSGNNNDTAGFAITGPSYGAYGASCGGTITSCYRVQVTAGFSVDVEGGYSVEIAKSLGTHTLSAGVDSSSINDDDLADGVDGLGSPGGEFAVDGAILTIKYLARRISSEASGITGSDYMTRSDAATNLIVYDFDAYYPDASEKNSGDGWQIELYDNTDTNIATFSNIDSSSANVTDGNWTLVSLANDGDWHATIKANDSVNVKNILTNGYYISVSKNTLTDLDFTSGGKNSHDATGTATDGGLSDPTGRFRIMNATELTNPPNRSLTLNFQNPGLVQSIRRGNITSGASFSFAVLYPDGTTYENNDTTSYIIRVKDVSDATIETFTASGSAQDGSNGRFRLSAVTNAANQWGFTLYALNIATIGNGYYVSIEKDNSGEGDTFGEEASSIDQPVNGKFNVDGGRLHVAYNARDNVIINRWDGSGTSDVTYTFNLYYEDNTELIAGVNASHIKVFDSSNADVTTDFDVTSGPAYSAGEWSVAVNPKSSVPAGTGYYIQLEYIDGSPTNDNVYTQTGNYYFNSNFTGTDTQNNQGLGTTNGVFEIRNATIEFVDIVDNDGTDNAVTERSASGSGITFQYRLYQGTSATEITTEAVDQVITLYRNAGTVVNASLYTVSGPTYTSGVWEYTIYPHKNFTIDNDFYIGVAKPTGSDVMQEFYSEATNDDNRTDGVDGLGTGVNNGEFQVINGTLAVQMDVTNGWQSGDGASANRINRQDGSPVTMDFTVRFDSDASSPVPFDTGSYLTNTEATGGTQSGTGSGVAVGSFLVTVRDNSSADVTDQFERIIAYQGSNTWRLTINALGGAPSGSGYYVEIEKATGDSFIGTAGSTSSLSSKAGSDAQSPYANNGALGSDDNGEFEVYNGPVTLAFQSMGVHVTSPVRRIRQGSSFADGVDVRFYMYYENGSQKDDTPAAETDESSFVVRIYNSSATLVDTITGLDNATNTGTNSLFEAGQVSYTGGNWQFNLRALGDNINYYDNYTISIEKTSGTDGDATSEIQSNSAVAAAPADSGLGGVNGIFDVSDLNITYSLRSAASMEQADNTGITYQFNIKEGDGTNKTGLTPADFNIAVYHTGSDVTASESFTLGTVTDLGGGNYSVNIQSSPSTTVQSGYYIRVSYNTASTSDVLDFYDSNTADDGGSPANTGLGATGEFSVSEQDALQMHFDSIVNQTMQRADSVGNLTNYTFTVYYPDGTNEGSDSGYQIRVYDESDSVIDTFNSLSDGSSDTAGNASFDLISFTRSGNSWVATLKSLKDTALDTASAGSGYYIAVSKPVGGGNNDTLPQASEVNSIDIIAAVPSSSGLGDTAGEGRLGISAASLDVDYTGKTYTSGVSVEKADDDTVSYTFRTVYPDGVTLETGENNYELIITDGTNSDIYAGLSSGSNDLAGNTYFDLIDFTNTAGIFTVTLRPKKEHSSLISNNWYITLQKTSGGAGEEDTTAGAIASTITDDSNLATDGGDGLGTGTGVDQGNLSVVNASLTAVFQNVSGSPQERGMALPVAPDGSNAVRYEMELFYDNSSDEILNTDLDIASVIVHIQDTATSSYRNADFLFWDGDSWEEADNAGSSVVVPNWDGGSGRWIVDILPKETALAEDYKINISKSSGVTGDALAGVDSTSNFTIDYATLNLTWDDPSGVKLERANGEGYIFSYTLSYANGVAVDNTNFSDTGLGTPSFTMRSTVNGDQTTNFYASGTFAATPDSSPNPTQFTITSGEYDTGKWKLRVTPEPGAALASDYYIRADKTSGDVISSVDSANFEITEGTLNVIWGQRNTTNGVINKFDRQDGTGTNYYFRLIYDDPAYELTTDAASIALSILKKSDDSFGSGFTIASAVYGNYGENLCSDTGQGNSNCWMVNITADATSDAAEYYPMLSKIAGTTSDIIDKKRSNYDYTGLGSYGEADDSDGSDDNNNLDPDGFTNTTGNGYALDDEDKSNTFTSDPSNYGHFTVDYEQTLNVKWLEKTVSKFWRGNGQGTFFAFRLFYEDQITQYSDVEHTSQSNTFTINIIDSSGTTIDSFAGLASNVSGVNGTNSKFRIENFSYDSGIDVRWELKLLALNSADIDSGYYIEVTSQNGGSGDFIPATAPYRTSNSAVTALAYEGGLGAGTGANQGEFALSNLCVKWIDRQNSQTEQNDDSSNWVNYRFEVYRDEAGTTCGSSGTEITSQGWADGDWNIIIRDSGGSNDNVTFTTSAPVNTNGVPNYNSGDGYWEYKIKANTTSTVVASDYSIDLEINDFAGGNAVMVHSSDDATDWDGGTPANYTIPPGMGTTDGRFEVIDATLNVEYVSRDTLEFEKVDGNGTNFYFRVFYDDGSYVDDTDVNSLTGSASYTFKIYDSSDNYQNAGQFSFGTPTYNGGNNQWKVNVQANIASVSATGYSFALLKDGSDPTGDSIEATNSFASINHEASSKTADDADFTDGIDGLGTTDGVFEVKDATLSVSFLTRSTDVFPKGDGTGVTFSAKTYYGDGVTQDENNAGSYTITVYDNGDNNITGDFNSSITWDSGNLEYDIQVQATVNATVASGYYIKITGGPSGAQVLDTGGRTPLSSALIGGDGFGNIGLGVPGGNFEVQGAPLSVRFVDVLSAVGADRVQRRLSSPADGSGDYMQLRLKAYYPNGTDEESQDVGYRIRIYDKNNVERTDQFLFWKWSNDTVGDSTGVWDSSVTTGGALDSVADNYVKYQVDSGQIYWYIRISPKENAGATTSYNNYYVSVTKEAGNRGDVIMSELKSSETDDDDFTDYVDGLGVNGTWQVNPADMSVKYVTDNNAGTNQIYRADDATDLAKIIVVDFSLYYGDQSTINSDANGGFSIVLYRNATHDVQETFNSVTPDSDLNTVGVDDFTPVTGTNSRFQLVNFGWDPSDSVWRIAVKPIQESALDDDYHIGITKSAGTGDGFENIILTSAYTNDAIGAAYSGGLGSGTGVGATGEWEIRETPLTLAYVGESLTSSPNQIQKADGTGVSFYYNAYFPDQLTNYTKETSDGEYTIKVYRQGSGEIDSFASVSPNPSGDTFTSVNGTNNLFQLINFNYDSVNIRWIVQITAFPDAVADPANYYYISVEKNDSGTAVFDENSIALKNSNDAVSGNSYDTGLGIGIDDGDNLTGEFELQKAELVVLYESLSATSIQRYDSNGTEYKWKVYYPDESTQEDNDNGAYKVILRNSGNVDVTDRFDIWNYNSSYWKTDFATVTGITGADYIRYDSGSWQIKLRPKKDIILNSGYYMEITKDGALGEGDTLTTPRKSNEPDNNDVIDDGIPNNSDGIDGLDVGGAVTVTGANFKIKYLTDNNVAANSVHRMGTSSMVYDFELYFPDTAGNCDNLGTNSCASEFEGSVSTGGYEIKLYADTNADSIPDSVVETFSGVAYTTDWATPISEIYGSNNRFALKNFGWENGSGRFKIEIRALNDTRDAVHTFSIVKAAVSAPDDNISIERISNTASIDSYEGGLGTGIGVGDTGEWMVNPGVLTMKYTGTETKNTVNQTSPHDGRGISYYFNLFYENNIEHRNGVEYWDGSAWQTDSDSGIDQDTAGRFTLTVYDSADAVVETFSDIDPSGAFTPVDGSNEKIQLNNFQYDGVNDRWEINIVPMQKASKAQQYYLSLSKADNGGIQDGDEETLIEKLSKDAAGTAYDGGLDTGMNDNEGEFEIIPASLIVQYAGLYKTDFPATSPVNVNRGAVAGTGVTLKYNIFFEDGTTEEKIDTGYTVKIFNTSASPVEVDSFDTSLGGFPIVGNKFTMQSFSYDGTNYTMEFLARQSAEKLNDYYFTVEKSAGTYEDTLSAYNSSASTAPDASGNQGFDDPGTLSINEGMFNVAGDILHIVYNAMSKASLVREDVSGTEYSWKIHYADSSEETDDITGYSLTVRRNDNSLADTFSYQAGGTPVAATGNYFYSGNLVYDSGNWKVTLTPRKTSWAENGYYIGVLKVAANEPDTLPEYASNASTTPDAFDNAGLDDPGTAAVNEGAFDVTYATLALSYSSRSNAVIEHGNPTSATTYAIRITYPNGTIFTDVDASGSDVSGQTNSLNVIIKKGAVDRTSDFTVTGFPVFDSSSGNWNYTIRAPYATPVETGFFIEADVSATGLDDVSATLASNDAAALGVNGTFDVDFVRLLATWETITPKTIQPGESTSGTLLLTFPDGSAFDYVAALNTSNFLVKKLENSTSDMDNFSIVSTSYLGSGKWKVVVTATGDAPSKAGNYLHISGTTSSSDLIHEAASNDETQLKENGVFVVMKEVLLYQNYPNPFNPKEGKTTIRIDIPEEDRKKNIEMKLFTVTGQLVKTFSVDDLVNYQRLYWDGKNDSGQIVASGIYYFVLIVGEERQFIKIGVVK